MKNSTPILSDDLLARYLASTATREEIERVQAWLDASPENLDELKGYRKLWERSGMIGSQQMPIDTDAAWEKMRAKMRGGEIVEESEREVVPLPTQKLRLLPSMWAAAAVALLALAFGGFYFYKMQNPQMVSVTTGENTFEKILPDSTKVILNYNSTLTFAEGLPGKTRTVSLDGEAFFDVAPDVAHPFVIKANGTEIRVVGTSFNVKAYDQAVRVDVKSGKVEVRKSAKVMELLPGEGVEVLADTVFRTLSANPNAAVYGTRVFDFRATPLAEVVLALSRGFHAEVTLADDRLANCRLNARYENESLDATLALIAETLTLQVKRQGDSYVLDGSGCR
ncbi:FecR domain-containing protein [Persicitalea sp.]|uniref:FecR family protein n=1 Tax=Persicitalea sp. TaxID=3100273 RepID=UPI003593CAC9